MIMMKMTSILINDDGNGSINNDGGSGSTMVCNESKKISLIHSILKIEKAISK